MRDYTQAELDGLFYIAYTKGGHRGCFNSEPVTMQDALDSAREALESGGDVVCIEPAARNFIASDAAEVAVPA